MLEDGLDLLTAIRAVLAARQMPNGTPMPSHLKHTLLTLAVHAPNIWPGQHRLADEMCVTRDAVNKRLRRLEDAGLVTRIRRSGGSRSTLYFLNLGALRRSTEATVDGRIQEEQEYVEDVLSDWDMC